MFKKEFYYNLAILKTTVAHRHFSFSLRFLYNLKSLNLYTHSVPLICSNQKLKLHKKVSWDDDTFLPNL